MIEINKKMKILTVVFMLLFNDLHVISAFWDMHKKYIRLDNTFNLIPFMPT